MGDSTDKTGARDAHYQKDIEYHHVIGSEYHAVVVEPRKFPNDLLFGPLDRCVGRGESMLDLGTGTGHMLLRYGSRFERRVGVDHSKEMLSSARKNLTDAGMDDTLLVRGDLFEFLEQDPSRYDLITCVGCIHHLRPQDMSTLMALIKRHLTAKGTLIIAEPIDVPYDCPQPILDWNAQSDVAVRTYSTEVEEPDEAPIDATQFLGLLTGCGLRVFRESRSWEILPHSPSPGFIEKMKMRVLHRRHGARGNVMALAIRRFDQSQT